MMGDPNRSEQALEIMRLILREHPDMSLNDVGLEGNILIDNLLKFAEKISPKFVFKGRHLGDPCIFCGCPYDQVEIGPCPGHKTEKMRDPNRIESTLEIIRLIWQECPDMRLGQLLINAMGQSDIFNIFYIEDDTLVKKLVDFALPFVPDEVEDLLLVKSGILKDDHAIQTIE